MKGFGVASRVVGLRSFQHAEGEYRTGLNSSTAVSSRVDSEGRGPTPFLEPLVIIGSRCVQRQGDRQVITHGAIESFRRGGDPDDIEDVWRVDALLCRSRIVDEDVVVDIRRHRAPGVHRGA